MAAIDAFQEYYQHLSEAERHQLQDTRKAQLQDLLSACSEDARIRIMQDAISKAKGLLKGSKSPRP